MRNISSAYREGPPTLLLPQRQLQRRPLVRLDLLVNLGLGLLGVAVVALLLLL